MGAERYWTAGQLANRYHLPAEKIRRLVNAGELPVERVRVGHHVLYRATVNSTINKEECAMNEQQQPAGKPRPVAVDENGQEPLDVEWVAKPRAEGGMMIGEDTSLQELARRADAEADAFVKIRKHSLKITTAGDWVIQGQEGVEDPEVYLEATGARKLALAWGIKMEDYKAEKQIERDSSGEYYQVMTTLQVTFRGRTMTEIGFGTSKDRFLAKGSDGPMASEDVNVGNVWKKSKTDCERRSVTNMLGLEALNLSELPKEYHAKIKRIGYGKGSKGGTTQTADERSTANKIWTTIVNMCAGDQKVAAELLWSVTKWQGKKGWMGSRSVEDLQKLSGKSFEITHEKCLAAWKTWKESGGQPYSMDDLKAEEALAPQQDAPPPDDDPLKGV